MGEAYITYKVFSPDFERGFFMSRKIMKTGDTVKKLSVAGMFCALAFVSMFVMHINVGFLTFDAKDALVGIASLLLGPVYALGMSLAVAFLEFISVGDTGFWGFLMDFISTAAFSIVCATAYKYMKNIKGAMIGLSGSVVSTTAIMLLFNLFIMPIYTPSITTKAVLSMIPTLLLPFNLTKALLNSAIVLILYKPVSKALKAANVMPKHMTEDNSKNKKNLTISIAVTAGGVILALVCIFVFFAILDADFSLV